MDMLISEIITGMNNDLKKDEIIKSKITSEINSLLFEKSRIEDIQNVSTRHMGNKEKKRFKKERTILLNNKENSAYIDYDISQCNDKLLDINNIIEEILVKWIDEIFKCIEGRAFATIKINIDVDIIVISL